MNRRQLLAALAPLLCGGGQSPVHARAPDGAGASRGGTLAWQKLPDLPHPRSGHSAGVSAGAILVAGGTDFPVPLFERGTKTWYDEVHILENGATGWRRGGKLPRPLAYAATVTVDDGIVMAGGSDATRHHSTCMSLAWREGRLIPHDLPSLPEPLAMAGAATLGSTVFVVGGQRTPGDTEASRSVWALDLGGSSPAWREMPPLPAAGRILPVVVAAGGTLYVFSGAALHASETGGTRREYLADGWRFGAGGSWRPAAAPPHPVVAAPAVADADGHLLVLGGDTGVHADRVYELRERHPGFSRDVLSYDTRHDRWRRIGSIPEGLVTTSALPVGDAIIVPGGEDRPGHRVTSVWKGTFR